ncbi:MAG: hypothetical protein ACOCV2_07695, partial [Persicimonas sp.]
FSPDQLAMWRRTRSSQERIVAVALAVALKVEGSKKDRLDTVWVHDPSEEFGSKIADGFDDVFESASKKCHFVLC